ncbi:SecY-interacting protein [Vibrio sp.]|uniref:Protein Syd n=1 Tax=Vibrio viridaestus TaxID=2487322 RepID=A0A3N9TEA5_9VIBR|nr:SecY-interacting protein [Vibrio viridaestus]MDC0610421.1 SecY-interacting protein [Vibrio sp.]RQW62439.1 SecY-interacting protein [Vibrio viridaestus]
MILSVKDALSDFGKRYVTAFQQKHECDPADRELTDWPSECVIERNQDAVLWRPVERQELVDLSNIEHAMDLGIHSDIHEFFGSFYSGDMTAEYEGEELSLIQVWNDDDFKRLQENIIGHLVTQKRLRLKPTIFIAGIDSEDHVISVCNLTGKVVKERLGTNQRQVLAGSLVEFIEKLEPVV